MTIDDACQGGGKRRQFGIQSLGSFHPHQADEAVFIVVLDDQG
jgi:hypothetical protein